MNREQSNNPLSEEARRRSAANVVYLCSGLMLLVAGVFGLISRSHPPGVEPYETFRHAIFWLILVGSLLMVTASICTLVVAGRRK